MRKLFEKAILPLHHLLSGRNILPHLRQAQENEWLSAHDLVALQTRRLRQLLAHAYQNVPFYQQRFLEADLTPDDVHNASDLVQLPPLTKDELRSNSETLIAANYRRSDLIARSTGGSTGVPTEFYYDRASWDSRVAAGYLIYTWAGWDFGIRRAILSGSPIERAVYSSIRGRLKTLLFREMFLDTFEMDQAARRRYLRRLQKFAPKVLYGYVSACVALANQVLSDGLAISIPSIIVSAEMLFPEQRTLIENAFHCQVFNLYGSREVAAIGMECPSHTGLHVPADRLVIEILGDDAPAPPGQPGEIAITDLLNYGMPFIRYKIGDMGRFIETTCPCGRQLPLLELTHGRILDLIVTPDGKHLPGEYFPHLFKEISNYVRQFQVIQERIDQLTVKIVPGANYGPDQTRYLRRKIEDRTGPGVKIVFQLVERIPPEKSGKHRVTISRLAEGQIKRT
jgi:phenylacetate-CoA ligase